MENGLKLKNWFVLNIKWIIVIIVIGISNYFILEAKVGDNKKEIVRNSIAIEKNTFELEKMDKTYTINKSLAKEIKFNLKRLMEKNGLEYIEDVDKMR